MPELDVTPNPAAGVAAAVVAGPAPGEPVPSDRGGRRSRRAVLGGLLVAVGLALVIVAFVAPLTLAATFLFVAVGVVVVINGLSRSVEDLRGKPFDAVFWLGCAWLVLLVGAAVLAPILPLGNHDNAVESLGTATFIPPQGLGGEHVLGTNAFGLDMLGRTVYGARTSLTVSLVAVLIGASIGGLVGMVAGFFGGAVDRITGILANALLAVPPLILLIALGTVLSPSIRNLALALSLLTIPSMVRLARANTITFAQREFVLAARSIGASNARLLTRELLPNVVLPLLSLAVVMVSMIIVAEASLSFLGLGVQPPEPTWGNMIAEGQLGVMEEHPFIVVVPGLCLFLTVFSFNLLGEKAQRRWDPRSAKL